MPATPPRGWRSRVAPGSRSAPPWPSAMRRLRLRAAEALTAPISVVLAAGSSSRLDGEGKASLELAGRPMLTYVLKALTGALDEVAVAAKASTALPGVSAARPCACRRPARPRLRRRHAAHHRGPGGGDRSGRRVGRPRG